MADAFTVEHRASIYRRRLETTYQRSIRHLTLSETAVCSPTESTG
jgi:hypothetical protein